MQRISGRTFFFERQPLNYEETRGSNPVDFLAGGIFSAHFVNTTCPEFLKEIELIIIINI